MTSRSAVSELFLAALDAQVYQADGALDVRAHRAELDGASANVRTTLAAPGADMVGRVIAIVATSVVNTVDCDYTAPDGAKTATFTAVGDTLILFGATENDWVNLTTPSGGIA